MAGHRALCPLVNGLVITGCIGTAHRSFLCLGNLAGLVKFPWNGQRGAEKDTAAMERRSSCACVRGLSPRSTG